MTAHRPDWGALYSDVVEATAILAEQLTPDQLSHTVPATPQWTVHQLLAHAAGGPADAVAGRMDDAPSPAWTGRHVAERADATVAQLVAELRSTSKTIAEQARDSARPAIVWDKAVHLADFHEALGLGVPDAALWEPILDSVAGWRLAALPLSVHVGGATYGAGGPDVTVAPYELFRAVFSRRSRAQIRAWAGSTPTDEQLDTIGLFGPREDDQPQP